MKFEINFPLQEWHNFPRNKVKASSFFIAAQNLCFLNIAFNQQYLMSILFFLPVLV